MSYLVFLTFHVKSNELVISEQVQVPSFYYNHHEIISRTTVDKTNKIKNVFLQQQCFDR